MSVHSNHYDTEEEYLRDLKAEYARDEYYRQQEIRQAMAENAIHYCDQCEYCKHGLRFVREAEEKDGRLVVKTTNKTTVAEYCAKDPDYIKEIHGYDEVCVEHGELYEDED